MVRLVERSPPVDDDRITDKLINGAIPLEDHLSHGRKVLVELSHHLLGRMRLAKACESDQVREQHGEFFALTRSEEHTSELQSRLHLVCRLLLEKKKQKNSE